MFLHRIQQMFHNYFTPFLISNTESLFSLTTLSKRMCISTGKWYSKPMMTGRGISSGSSSSSDMSRGSTSSSGGGGGGSGSGSGGGGGDHFIWLIILTTGVLAWRIRKGPCG